VVAHIGEKYGVSIWVSAVATFVVFFFVNGTLAYVLRARQLKREGKAPPAYTSFMFQTQSINQPMQVPSLVRVALGLVVILGAGLFVFAGGVLVFAAKHSGYVIGGGILLLLGATFAYVGYRVIRMNRPGRRLFGADQNPNAA
jgi:hypothetical protein